MLSDHIPGMGGTTIAPTGPGYGFGPGWGVRLQDGFAWVPRLPGRRHVGGRVGHQLLDRSEGYGAVVDRTSQTAIVRSPEDRQPNPTSVQPAVPTTATTSASAEPSNQPIAPL
jgi:hypothetical protein